MPSSPSFDDSYLAPDLDDQVVVVRRRSRQTAFGPDDSDAYLTSPKHHVTSLKRSSQRQTVREPADEDNEMHVEDKAARRRAQNRQSQRKFRHRKADYLRGLERRVASSDELIFSLRAENNQLRKAAQRAKQGEVDLAIKVEGAETESMLFSPLSSHASLPTSSQLSMSTSSTSLDATSSFDATSPDQFKTTYPAYEAPCSLPFPSGPLTSPILDRTPFFSPGEVDVPNYRREYRHSLPTPPTWQAADHSSLGPSPVRGYIGLEDAFVGMTPPSPRLSPVDLPPAWTQPFFPLRSSEPSPLLLPASVPPLSPFSTTSLGLNFGAPFVFATASDDERTASDLIGQHPF